MALRRCSRSRSQGPATQYATTQAAGDCPVWGGGGPDWVRFASPQVAPTAPATTVFIALSSVRRLMRLLSACPSAQQLGSGARTLPSCSAAPGQPSPVGLWLWECKHSARLTPLRLVNRHVGPVLNGVRGVHAGQGVIRGQALASAGPSRHKQGHKPMLTGQPRLVANRQRLAADPQCFCLNAVNHSTCASHNTINVRDPRTC